MHRNMNNTVKAFPTIVATATLALAFAAGTASALNGPDTTKRTTPDAKRVDMDARLLHFARADALIGSELRNTTADSIGSVSDFIVDRGSGRIEFALVKSGDFLGFGGKTFALPYGKLRFMPTDKGFQTSMTKEQLQRSTQFIPDDWDTLKDRGWLESASSWLTGDDSNRADEPMRAAIKKGDREEIDGRVTRIDRKSFMGNEQVVVTVEDEDNEQRTLILGPSWYVMGFENSIRVGDEVEFSAVSYDRHYLVTDGRLNNKRVTFRDNDGKGVWDAKDSKNRPARYVLLSDISGMSAEMVGSTVGEIQTSLVEGGSGQVAMLALDPNENLFGLGDELSLIPWSATTITSNAHVMINGNEAKLEQALKMPSDVSTLRTPSSVAHAYEVFGLEIPEFNARDKQTTNGYGDRDRDANRDRDAMGHGDAWSNQSTLVKALRDGKDIEIQGKYKGMSTASVIKGAPEARILEINTSDGVKRLIVAPVWYSEHQKLNLKSGDSVTINAKRATIEGREWLAVVDIENGDNHWSFWDGQTPIWSN